MKKRIAKIVYWLFFILVLKLIIFVLVRGHIDLFSMLTGNKTVLEIQSPLFIMAAYLDVCAICFGLACVFFWALENK